MICSAPFDRKEGCFVTSSIFMAWKIIFPVIFMLLTGIACRKAGLVGKQTVQDINRLVFHLFLPLLNFVNIYSTPKDAFLTRDNLVLLGICVVVTVASILAASYVLKLRRCPMPVRSVMVQGVYQTNGVIFALPIITALCGSNQLAPLSLLILVLSPMYMVFSVLVLEPVRGGSRDLRRTAGEILRNPLLIASMLAFLLLLLDIRLPAMLTGVMQTMANVTTPLSFVALGASLQLNGFQKNWKRIWGVGLVRLVAVPGLCLAAGLLLGLRDSHIATLVGLMSAPVAVSSFTLAQTYGADGELAAQIVTATTVAAAVTMFCWIALLNSLGLL